MKSCKLLAALALTGLSVSAGLSAQAQDNRVLVIGVDGLRPDAMEFANTPNIDALIANGLYSSQAQGEDITISGPNWSSVLHGVHRDLHNVSGNSYSGSQLASYPDFLARLESHDASLTTARFTSWTGINSQPTGADIDTFNASGNYLTGTGDINNTAAAVDAIANQNAAATFLYLHDPDSAGHSVSYDSWLNGGSPTATGYTLSIEDVDSQVGQVMAAINGRATIADENWLIVLTSDHGGRGTGHAGNTPDRRTVPFIVSGSSVMTGQAFPAPKNLDVSRTVLAHMGLSEAEMSGLDGHAFGLTQSPLPQIGFGHNLVFNGDAEYDRGFTETTFDHAVSGWNDPGNGEGSPTANALEYGHDYWAGLQGPAGADLGDNFFHGGRQDGTAMTQTIDLSSLASTIDQGDVDYALLALLGGWEDQDDSAKVVARFFAADGTLLGTATLDEALSDERGDQSLLLLREATGDVLAGTRSVEIALSFDRVAGTGNDGFADNISFVLVPEPSSAVLLIGTSCILARRRRRSSYR